MFIRLEEYRRYLLWKATNRRGGDSMRIIEDGDTCYECYGSYKLITIEGITMLQCIDCKHEVIA